MLDNIKSSHIFFVHLYTLKSLSELRIKQKIIVFDVCRSCGVCVCDQIVVMMILAMMTTPSSNK